MKTKLRWDFPPQAEMHTVEVLNIRNITTDDPSYLQNLRSMVTCLRPCLFGYNEQGEPVKILYCTRDGQFYLKYPDGWHEQIPSTSRVRRGKANGNAKAGGGFDTAYMQNFGGKSCHRLIAYAWCEWPKAAKTDPEWYKSCHGYEIDHKNCDHGNYCADNLEWVTSKENIRRRYKVEDPLKKAGIKPQWINIPHLDAIYRMEECQLEYFFELLPDAIAKDERELTLENVNDVISSCIDDVTLHTIRCSRCGCKMIEGTGEHNTHNSILCDCCFTDLYGYF